MFDGNHTTNQNGDGGMVYGIVLTTVHWKGMDRLERRCFPAFGTCWISAACHPPWTAVSSSAATPQRIGAVPAASGHRDAASEVGCDEERSWNCMTSPKTRNNYCKNKGLWIELIDHQRRIRASEPAFIGDGSPLEGAVNTYWAMLRVASLDRVQRAFWRVDIYQMMHFTKWQNPIMGHEVVPLQLCLLVYKCLSTPMSQFDIPSGYLTVRHGKSPFLRTVNHLFLWFYGPSKNHGYVSHNQRVSTINQSTSAGLPHGDPGQQHRCSGSGAGGRGGLSGTLGGSAMGTSWGCAFPTRTSWGPRYGWIPVGHPESCPARQGSLRSSSKMAFNKHKVV